MDSARGDRFIDMYVNDRTLDYGDEGRQAIQELLSRSFDDVRLEWAE
jgi:1,4-dihydroxy-6-naphthoate synthase